MSDEKLRDADDAKRFRFLRRWRHEYLGFGMFGEEYVKCARCGDEMITTDLPADETSHALLGCIGSLVPFVPPRPEVWAET